VNSHEESCAAVSIRAPPVRGAGAGIAACHARAATIDDTDWARIAALYEVLERLWPTPVVQLNRAVAVGMAQGPAAGLQQRSHTPAPCAHRASCTCRRANVPRVRTVYVIGIGAGDPEHLTLGAIAAMNRVDVFFTIDKGAAKGDLGLLRTALLDRHVTRPHRVVEARDPQRDRTAAPGAYEAAVVDWQDRRESIYEGMIADELDDAGCGAFLVWGDPALYDGTLRILDRINARGAVAFDVRSIPGISSVQALAAQHRLILNRIGRPFTVTTGRRLAADGFPPGVDDVVVMLDSVTAFAALPDTDVDIYWGAYLGTPDELLVHGDLQQVKDEIVRIRGEHRERKGWIMDTYLLRRRIAE
jgi:precorrin-6A synthase